MTLFRYCYIFVITMNQILTITPKWQIYLPQRIRNLLGLTKPVKLMARVEKNRIIITPQKSKVLMIAGKYKRFYQKKAINLEKIRENIDYSQL